MITLYEDGLRVHRDDHGRLRKSGGPTFEWSDGTKEWWSPLIEDKRIEIAGRAIKKLVTES